MKNFGKDAGAFVAVVCLLWTCAAAAQSVLRQPESLIPKLNSPTCDETELGSSTDLFAAPGTADNQDPAQIGQLPGAGNAGGQGAANLGYTGQANSNSLASSLGNASAAQAAAPFMIGDLFGTGTSSLLLVNDGIPNTYHAPGPNGSGAQFVGTAKIAENTSPLPRDRVFFNYSYFDNVQLIDGGAGVNRYTPGFEKTFFNRMTSIELRVPSASTVSPNIILNGTTPVNRPVFGDMSLTFKGLLHQTSSLAVSVGLQCAIPTAPALTYAFPAATPFAQVSNNSFHAMPFLGFLYTPNDRLFAQGFFQADIDTNGNRVYVSPDPTNSVPLVSAGRLQDPTFLYVDLGVGYWLFRDDSTRGISGIAPTLELHYNTSLQPGDSVSYSNPFGVAYGLGNTNQRVQVLNFTGGCFMRIGQQTTVTLGYTTTVGNGSDRQFDGELRVFVNRLFGSQSPASLVSF